MFTNPSQNEVRGPVRRGIQDQPDHVDGVTGFLPPLKDSILIWIKSRHDFSLQFSFKKNNLIQRQTGISLRNPYNVYHFQIRIFLIGFMFYFEPPNGADILHGVENLSEIL